MRNNVESEKQRSAGGKSRHSLEGGREKAEAGQAAQNLGPILGFFIPTILPHDNIFPKVISSLANGVPPRIGQSITFPAESKRPQQLPGCS